MTLGEKVRKLRELEGNLRDLGRAMTQSEVARAILHETGQSISQAYLSQVENGRRVHLTDTTRMLLARFFRVHPGHLVNEPDGPPQPSLHTPETRLDLWLVNGAERFAPDADLRQALLALAGQDDSRRCLLLLRSILEVPGLADRLSAALHPEVNAEPRPVKRKPRKGNKRQ